MKNVDDLIESAADLARRGLSKGEIADELNVSRETASWLIDRSGSETSPKPSDRTGDASPQDIHVDWSAFGRDSDRLSFAGAAMADLLSKGEEEVDLTVGIEKAGVPLATVIARELSTDLSTYTPRKHQWEEGDIDELEGTFSRNFASIRGRACYIVDDIVTSGTTMTETISAVRDRGGEPVACVVLTDKKGVETLDGVPVFSLLQVIRVGNEE